MNANQILNEVMVNKKTLVFVARKFADDRYMGIFIKDSDGALTKVHGKSAKVARNQLMSLDGALRSYGKGYLSSGKKTLAAYLTEFRFAPELIA